MDIEKLIDFFKNDRFATLAGIVIEEVKPGYCKASMKIEDKHLNSVNVVQGGAIFTLADYAFALAVNSRGQLALAINANISFMKGKSSGTLYAIAREVADPKRIGVYEVDVVDEEGVTISKFNGVAYRKNEKLNLVTQ
jgi:acyl-CoA thioesterase